MEILAEWNFENYAASISKKYLNQNVKHVMKEGGRAGKALVVNTESLISTVQVLSVAGGAAKAAQVMSVTTGVMSGLFLALDVFFLAKDSMELKKGAKTEFAAKIREVCKDLQNGLLELNRIKEQLQKTMDGIEEEEDEEQLKPDCLNPNATEQTKQWQKKHLVWAEMCCSFYSYSIVLSSSWIVVIFKLFRLLKLFILFKVVTLIMCQTICHLFVEFMSVSLQ